jgi:hypothetical protein
LRWNSAVNRLPRAALVLALLALLGCSHKSKPSIPAPPANASETSRPYVPHTAPSVPPLAPPSLHGYCRSGDPLFGVYSPGRLSVKNPCVAVTGVVWNVVREHDGDLHISLTEVDHRWLNAGNVNRTRSDLVVEIVPDLPLPEPAVRSRVTIIGPWVLDTETGWLEIHPAWKILPAG